jgi:hypothetical protein
MHRDDIIRAIKFARLNELQGINNLVDDSRITVREQVFRVLTQFSTSGLKVAMHILVLRGVMPSIYSIAFTTCLSIISLRVSLSALQSLNRGWANLVRLHQIPCDRCAFFTGEFNLKCTVHPCKAFNEQAINCQDYEPGIRSPIWMQWFKL